MFSFGVLHMQKSLQGQLLEKRGISDLSLLHPARLNTSTGTPKCIEEWLSTPSSHGVTIKGLKMTKPDQLVVVAFWVTGMSANDDGNYEFGVSFYRLDPNEKPIFGQRNYVKGKGKRRAASGYARL